MCLDSSNADALQGPLHEAVDAVRSQEPPPEALNRALDRARSLDGNPGHHRPWLRSRVLVAAGVAALVVFAVALGTAWRMQESGHGATGLWGVLTGSSLEEQNEGDPVTLLDKRNGVHTTDSDRGIDPEIPLTYDVQPSGTASVPGEVHSTGRVRPRTLDPRDGRQDEKELKRRIQDALEIQQELRSNQERLRRVQQGMETNILLPLREPPVEFPPAGTPGARNDKGKEPGSRSKPSDLPQTWKRDHQRPTFARVYVGDGNALELVSLQVTVTIEGPRARTLVDHVFRNPHDRQLEGTFEYPLPTGASPSYFAMFLGQARDTVPPRFARSGEVPPLPAGAAGPLTPEQIVRHVDNADWGRLQEARVVEKQRALETYEAIVRGRIDPALLEYAGGNTFTGRVFPIPARAYNRVLIAYEELLPVAQSKTLYRYPLPDCKLADLRFTLHARSAECKDVVFRPNGSKKEEGGGRIQFSRTWTEKGPGGDVVFAFTPPDPQVQAISGRQNDNGPRFVCARIRPELKVEAARPFAEHAVFVLDTSLSEHPDRFAVSMKLLQKVLENDPDIKRFNVLAFNVGAAWVEPKGWLPNTREGRDQALARLDGVVLEGATDLSAALDRLARPGFAVAPGTPLNVFLLSDGQITWGEPDVGTLVARFEGRSPFVTRFHCYRTGIGADNLELFEALTRRGGGTFNCFTEADLAAAAAAHRSQCFHVERVRLAGGPVARDLLVAGRKAAIYPGGELVVAARVEGTGAAQVVVEGVFLGKREVLEYPLEITTTSELAPRGWAEIAVASLLELNDPRLDPVVTAYCQQFGIAGRTASFLVLENDADYKRLNLEEERGKTIAGDLGRFLENAWQELGRMMPAKEAYQRFLNRADPRIGLMSEPVKRLLALLGDADFELPEAVIAGAILRPSDVPPAYRKALGEDRRNVSHFLSEARRRAGDRDAHGAVRALSSVIEEYAARSDALRLVGYRLLDLEQPAQAARLFAQVQRGRPFEPHSYRDLARGLEGCGKLGLAAVQYEIVLAGTWHNRFRDSLKEVAREEYAQMLRDALRRGTVKGRLAEHFGWRLEQLDTERTGGDLRVTISWNTDATDVDLWVIEPDRSKVYYSQRRSASGGELSQDQTQGYGPERYQITKAPKGAYRVVVHYYSPNQNLLAGETHVNVVVTRFAGTPREVTERHTVILKRPGEEVEVCQVEF